MNDKQGWNIIFWVYLICGVLLSLCFSDIHLVQMVVFGRIVEGLVLLIVFGLAINAKTGWFFWL
jgi:hypothetical protein